MRPEQAGRRLILLSLPFLFFGLYWARWPPIVDVVGEDIVELTQALGVALALLALGAVGFGVYLIRRDAGRVL